MGPMAVVEALSFLDLAADPVVALGQGQVPGDLLGMADDRQSACGVAVEFLASDPDACVMIWSKNGWHE